MADAQEKYVALVPPPESSCISCACKFTNLNEAINEIHIYTAANQFERSISILDALEEVFATDQLKMAKSSNFNILMCTKCAEIMSIMYKQYHNLIAQTLSSAGSYLRKLITHIDDLCQEGHGDGSRYFPIFFDMDLEEDGEDDNEENMGSLYTPCVEYGAQEHGGMRTRSQTKTEIAHSLYQDGNTTNGMDRTTNGGTKHKTKLFKCHYKLCDFSERYNFKLFEHLLSSHQNKEPNSCKCGFKFYPEIYKLESHRCSKKPANCKKLKSEIGIFLCEVCGKGFRGEKSLLCHLEKVHVSDDIKFACGRSECAKKFDSRRRLLFHVELQHRDRRLHLCSDCGRTFKLRSTLAKHIKLHGLSLEERILYNRNRIDKNKGPLGTFKCKDCDRTYTRSKYLNDHIKFKHQSESWKYKCPICEKPYFQRRRLLGHVKTHNPNYVRVTKTNRLGSHFSKIQPRPFLCVICNKKFKYKAFLLTHQKTDHRSNVCEDFKETEHIIENDGTTSDTTTALPRQIDQDTQSTSSGLTLPIEEVQKEINEGDGQQKEKESDPPPVLLPFLPYEPQQDETKAWKCDQCGKSFTKMRALKVHYRTHTGETPELFTCVVPTCNHQFRRKFDLKEHMKKHPKKELEEKEEELTDLNLKLDELVTVSGTEKQRYQCHVCSYFFADKKYLRRHLLGHTGAHRKIPCPICDYKTSTRTLLKGHMRTNHKDEIPEEEKNRWKCDTCSKSFAAERNLKDHILIHTGEIFRFPCTIESCGEKLRTKTSQESHMFTHHPEKLSAEVLNRWKCKDCGKPFGNRKNLTEHQRLHKGIHLRLECSLCGLGVRHKGALESHIRAKHKEERKKRSARVETRKLSGGSPVKRGRGRPRKQVVKSSESENEGKEERLDLGTFWKCDICHRSFSTDRGFSRSEHIRVKHSVTPIKYQMDRGKDILIVPDSTDPP